MGPGKEWLIKEHTRARSGFSSERHQKALKSHSSGELPSAIGCTQAQNKQEMSLAPTPENNIDCKEQFRI